MKCSGSPIIFGSVDSGVGAAGGRRSASSGRRQPQLRVDPVHLMRVFGISAKTAMTYIQAAHPERRPTLPR